MNLSLRRFRPGGSHFYDSNCRLHAILMRRRRIAERRSRVIETVGRHDGRMIGPYLGLSSRTAGWVSLGGRRYPPRDCTINSVLKEHVFSIDPVGQGGTSLANFSSLLPVF